MPGTLSNDDLTRLYTWVDEINLSRPKRNIARDFSDGVLVAEVRFLECLSYLARCVRMCPCFYTHRHPAHPVPAPILHPRKIQDLRS